jgi:hypothetical protein
VRHDENSSTHVRGPTERTRPAEARVDRPAVAPVALEPDVCRVLSNRMGSSTSDLGQRIFFTYGQAYILVELGPGITSMSLLNAGLADFGGTVVIDRDRRRH